MAKGIYVGIGGTARKVKKAYVGIGGVARKVKKVYVGIGGIARLSWSAEPGVSLYTTLYDATGVYYPGTSKVGNYSIFAGGGTYGGTDPDSYVNAYNNSFVKTTATVISIARAGLVGAMTSSYALFGGGDTQKYSSVGGSYIMSTVVDAYNSTLTRSTPTALTWACRRVNTTSVGVYALFIGGEIDNSLTGTNKVNAYSNRLTRFTPTTLSQSRCLIGSTKIGDYALAAGGCYGFTYYANVDAYNTSLTKTTPTSLTQSRYAIGATSVGSYAIMAGGGNNNGENNLVEAYNTSLVRSTITSLSQSTYLDTQVAVSLKDTPVGDFALIPRIYQTFMDYYDTVLTRKTLTGVNRSMGSVSIGAYALMYYHQYGYIAVYTAN